jgi:hypothetical protein
MLVLDARGKGEADKARKQAEHLGVPFNIFAPSNRAVAELYGTPLALIRPDQHVAWRGNTVPADLLARVAGHDCRHSNPGLV